MQYYCCIRFWISCKSKPWSDQETGETIKLLEKRYSGEQRRAVEFSDGHLQIIACAGSGKTETVARKCAVLLKKGVKPEEIVAFTFTEKAADELRSRIEGHVREMLSDEFLDLLNPMFVGTIHSFCLRLLKESLPKFAIFDALDQHRLAGFLSREFEPLGLEKLGAGKQWKTIALFLDNTEVVENELLSFEQLGNNTFSNCYKRFCEALRAFRLLTFGQMIALAVNELQRPETRNRIFQKLKYLIVDEYQDINPAQEALIRLMAGNSAYVTVVGDDLQAIYQWRGSTVENILTFSKRFKRVHQETLSINYRSRPSIISTAENFSQTISPKLPKEMKSHRSSSEPEVVCWRSENPYTEAETIAEAIERLVANGYHYGDCAILLRSVRTSSEPFIRAFENRNIAFNCVGRTGLFRQPDAQLLGKTHAWLVDCDWQESRQTTPRRISLDALIEEYDTRFTLDERSSVNLRRFLMDWKAAISSGEPCDLVRDFYGLLDQLKVHRYSTNDPLHIAKLGTLARFSQLLVDFESMARRTYVDGKNQIVSPQSASAKWLYRQLYLYIQYYALEAYEGFAGEEHLDMNAVDIMTVHQSKGLEWPIVFVPCLTVNRFPSSKTGTKREWFVPKELFDHARYEGTEMDERRLFYVAITRAKDTLYASGFSRITRPVHLSPFLNKLSDGEIPQLNHLPVPHPETTGPVPEQEKIRITFSQLALYEFCPYAFRLRQLIGFEPPMAVELGYGKAIHRIMQSLAEFVRTKGTIPDEREIEQIFREDFYLPYANKFLLEKMKTAALKIINLYIRDFSNELKDIWETERTFELHLENGTISGRADAILRTGFDEKNSEIAIVDYKTSLEDDEKNVSAFQLSVYALAGQREGLNISKAYLHDLKKSERILVSVNKPETKKAETRAKALIDGLSAGHFSPRVGVHCFNCDVRWMCREGRLAKR